jgi:hypothetical protein
VKKTLAILIAVGCLLWSFDSFTNRNGAGAGYTNAPSESNCTSCHSGSLITSGNALNNFTLTHNFTGGGYIPDSTYNITVTYSESGISRFGFQITALTSDSDDPAGDFASGGSRTRRLTRNYSGKTRVYIEHTSTGSSTTSTNTATWNFDWTAPNSNVGDVTFYAVVNAANNNGGNSGDKIYAKTFTFSPSTLLPVATASTQDTIICEGSSADFNGSGTNGANKYFWLFPGGQPGTSTAQNPTITYNTDGTKQAILRVQNNKGWSTNDTIEIEVKASPTATVQGAGDRFICRGDQEIIAANVLPGLSYEWSNGVKSDRITVTQEGDYFVTATNTSGCSKISRTIKVRFYRNEVVSLSSSEAGNAACANGIFRLTASEDHDSFYWYKDGNLLQVTSDSFLETSTAAETHYQVAVKDSNGCIGSLSDTLTMKITSPEPAPVVTCDAITPSSLTFAFSGPSHGGLPQVSEDSGKTWRSPSFGTFARKHTWFGLPENTQHELWVRYTTTGSCAYTQVGKQFCTTGTCDTTKATLTYNKEVCDGETVELKLSGLSENNFYVTLDDGQPIFDSIIEFTPSFTKAYILKIYDSAWLGCTPQTIQVPIEVSSIGPLRFKTQKASNIFCQYDSIRFSAAEGYEQYQFYVNGQLRATTADSFYYENTFNTFDSAWVQVKNGGCEAVSPKIFISKIPDPDPGFTYTSNRSVYSFSPNDKNYANYFWDFGDGFTSVLMEPDHDYAAVENTTVQVKLDVEDNNGCVNDTTESITLPKFSSVQLVDGSRLVFYPNPATDVVRVEGLNGSKEYRVYDAQGRFVESGELSKRNNVLDVTGWAKGLYSIQIGQQNSQATLTLLVR